MKHTIHLFAAAVLMALCFAACQSGTVKPRPTASEEFQASLTEADSTQMLQLAADCMELLKRQDIDGALAMLYEYDDSLFAVRSLGDETRARYQRIFRIFPVHDYKLSEFTFMLEGLNNVKYDVVFAEGTDGESSAHTAFMFNPVKVDGQWYLTVKRPDQAVSVDETIETETIVENE